MDIRLFAKLMPAEFINIFILLTVFSKLSKGSPMPIKTILVILGETFKLETAKYWPIISEGVKFLLKPFSPLAQKRHLNLQPT